MNNSTGGNSLLDRAALAVVSERSNFPDEIGDNGPAGRAPLLLTQVWMIGNGGIHEFNTNPQIDRPM